MQELEIEQQARGTRILLGCERRLLINTLAKIAEDYGCEELTLPTIEPISLYNGKLGGDTGSKMWLFQDKAGRDMCLRPEATATCQALARKYRDRKNWKLWYETRCFRYERPQAGRYREFTQFGVEILNPKKNYLAELMELAVRAVASVTGKFDVNSNVARGLSYYTGDGFEISCWQLGAQKQVVGGGRYAEGIGFAVGVDRLLMAARIGG